MPNEAGKGFCEVCLSWRAVEECGWARLMAVEHQLPAATPGCCFRPRQVPSTSHSIARFLFSSLLRSISFEPQLFIAKTSFVSRGFASRVATLP